jgi:hypothetical protein
LGPVGLGAPAWATATSAGVPRPGQAPVPEPGFDTLAEPFFQEGEQVVDTQRLDRRLVRTGQNQPRFAPCEPTSRPIETDLAVGDGERTTTATGSEKLSHQRRRTQALSTQHDFQEALRAIRDAMLIGQREFGWRSANRRP